MKREKQVTKDKMLEGLESIVLLAIKGKSEVKDDQWENLSETLEDINGNLQEVTSSVDNKLSEEEGEGA